MTVSGIAAARRAITRLQGVVKEAVHVKIHPRPRNLAESREVLRILQQYGEVTMYKHLKVSGLVFQSVSRLVGGLSWSPKEKKNLSRFFLFILFIYSLIVFERLLAEETSSY